MKHPLLLLFLTIAALSQVKAQSLTNTNWKAYVGDPLYDTLTLHIKTDSSFVTGSNGSVAVRSLCKISRDTVSFSDYDGQYACPNTTGRYTFALSGDLLNFTLIDDPCEGRASAVTTAKWRKAAAGVTP
jgi:hypothetical protein